MLGLRGRGELGVSSCTFGDEFITARHPLLGEINIRRSSVASLERAGETAGEADEETEEEEE